MSSFCSLFQINFGFVAHTSESIVAWVVVLVVHTVGWVVVLVVHTVAWVVVVHTVGWVVPKHGELPEFHCQLTSALPSAATTHYRLH